MEGFVTITKKGKEEVYEEIIPQIDSLVRDESDLTANLGNCTAVLKMAFPQNVSWVGFYLRKSHELVLGPFQGKPACVRIKMGQGVCGKAASEGRTVVVPNVAAFPGHIVCDPGSKSEIVVPVLRGSDVLGVLDLDSPLLSYFDEVDKNYLERIMKLILLKFEKQSL